jgi:shikimate kinase
MRDEPPRPANIYLVGLMGAGKTAVGQMLARALNRPFLDSDHEIIARTGVSISTIFDIEGEAGFRDRESRVIGELTKRHHIVLATGGGAILAEANRKRLHESGWVIYLRHPPEVLVLRTSKCREQRPMLKTRDPLALLQELYSVRDPLYCQTAHLVLDAPQRSIHGISQYLLAQYAQLA